MLFKLKAPVKDYIWGGTKLRDEYGKSGGDRLAESWELSCHHDGLSIIDKLNIPLVEYLAKHPEYLGGNCKKFDDFPVLIKLIDAKDNLSIQVHPDEKYAQKHEGDHGKTEMWYIIDCEPDSSIIYGFKNKITRSDFRQAIENNTLLDKVNTVPVRKGDVFMIKAGTLHAIGKGCLIAEIQQSSNVTYRVYDYGRGRKLHIENALDVTDCTPTPVPRQNHNSNLLAKCEYFSVYREDISDYSIPHKNTESFTHVLILDGNGEISGSEGLVTENKSFRKGDSFFIGAGSEWKIIGKCSIIYTVI